jgi:hypothetical protein
MADQYPAKGLTPNLDMTLEGMSVGVADNFITLDAALISGAYAQFVNISDPKTLTYIVPEDAVYFVSLWFSSNGTGVDSQWLSVNITFTEPGEAHQGTQEFQGSTYPNNSFIGPVTGDAVNQNNQSFMIPIFAAKGTPIIVNSFFSNPTSPGFGYNFVVSIVALPQSLVAFSIT